MPEIMITLFSPDFNTLDQDSYDSLIASLQFHQLRCPKCGHSGCMTIHGYYTRHVKTPDSVNSLYICRVICSGCRSTHALLPSSLVPYSQIPLCDQLQIIADHESGSKHPHRDHLFSNPFIDESSIKSVISRYVRVWYQRLVSIAASVKMSAGLLIQKCFERYSRQFMQVRRTTNSLFLFPT